MATNIFALESYIIKKFENNDALTFLSYLAKSASGWTFKKNATSITTECHCKNGSTTLVIYTSFYSENEQARISIVSQKYNGQHKKSVEGHRSLFEGEFLWNNNGLSTICNGINAQNIKTLLIHSTFNPDFQPKKNTSLVSKLLKQVS